ncbi:MAG: DUF4458 domain-containing protein [Phocaeicola sp.]
MKNKIGTYFFLPLLMMLCAYSFVGCSETKEILDVNKGFVQFKLHKSGDESQKSRGSSELEYLNDAKKIEVILIFNNATIRQTLNLNAYNAESAEFGLTSDKLELLAGDYTLAGYRLFDGIDQVILEGFTAENKFKVVPGGLAIKKFPVAVVERGKVRFTLTKDLPEEEEALMARSSSPSYLFSNVAKADIVVCNTFTGEETTFNKIAFKYSTFVEGSVGNTTISASAKADSLVSLKAGNYVVVSYTLYNRSGTWLDANDAPQESSFTVADNVVTEADAQITISTESENIKDYRALKAIWKALNGERWSYFGQNYPIGINWNFDKDIDMWGDQPGVTLNSQGRVISLVLGDFGPEGDVPEELGQLTELNILSLGTHNDRVRILSGEFAGMGSEEVMASRNHYADIYLKKDVRASFSKELVDGYKKFSNIEFGNEKPLVALAGNRASTRDVLPGDICNKITSLPESIGNLTKLTHLYIANGWVSELPESMSELISLTDFELYNCPKMVKYPDALNTIPKLVALNIARNIQMPHDELYRGLDEFATSSPSKGELQLIYIGYNNLEAIPESFKNLVRIGLLDISHNKLSGTITSLTTDVKPVQIFLNNNEIEALPDDFCGTDDIEFIYLNDNKLKKVPNIFSAASPYTIDEIDLSFNEIDGFVDGYKGVNVKTLNLSANKLTEFPSILFNATATNVGSVISMLNLHGNKIEKFEEDLFHGPKMHLLESLDMGNNQITALPKKFDATTLPYLYGLDVSGNAFSDFPYGALNITRLTILMIRNQRDSEGKRTLKTWPKGLYTCPSLRGFYIGGNDLRKVDDTISYLIYVFEIIDNPNISIDLSEVCPYISAGTYQLIYDKSQDIRGCDALNLTN